MPLFSFEGLSPTVHPDAFIAPTATLVGDVRVEAHASIWYNAVLRADFGPIIIREGANVQDGCVLHGGNDPITEVGAGATIGHLCVVHGCVIGPEALIGNGSTIQDGARIGARCLVGAGATVAPNTVVPDETLVLDTVGREKGPLTQSARWWVEGNPGIYQELARRHRAGVEPVVPMLGGLTHAGLSCRVRARLDEIVIDCHDPARLVRFWAALVGGEPVDREPGWSYVDPPGMPRLAFQAVPEAKATKNRLHLDLSGPAVTAAADEAVGLGATRSGDVVTDAHGSFQVMLDPEGNEFCFVE